MYLSEKDVRGIATYARIGLNDTEVAEMTSDLNAIIASLEPIRAYDLHDVAPTFHPIAGLANVMRSDSEGTSLAREQVLANAPVVQDGLFRVPPILGDAGGDK